MLIFIQRGTSVPFFLRFFGGAAKSPHVTLSEGEESLRLRLRMTGNKNARSQSAVQKVTQTPEFLRFRPLRAKFFRNLSIE